MDQTNFFSKSGVGPVCCDEELRREIRQAGIRAASLLSRIDALRLEQEGSHLLLERGCASMQPRSKQARASYAPVVYSWR
jgi:hypothetical protein